MGGDKEWRAGGAWRREQQRLRQLRVVQISKRLSRARRRLYNHPAVYEGVLPTPEDHERLRNVEEFKGGLSVLKRMGVGLEDVTRVKEWVDMDKKINGGVWGERRRLRSWWGKELPEGVDVRDLGKIMGKVTDRDFYVGNEVVGVKRLRNEREADGSKEGMDDGEGGETEEEVENGEGGEEDDEDEPILKSQRRRKKLRNVSTLKDEEAEAVKTGAKSQCCLCPPPIFFDGNELESELSGPYLTRRGTGKLFVHPNCGCWAPLIFSDPVTGILRKVADEYDRGRMIKCAGCGTKGATVGCYVHKCKKSFHLRCIQSEIGRRVDEFFVAFCGRHAHLADTSSYKMMMKAAAEFSAKNFKRLAFFDRTWGMDAPHSKYTLLKIRETEIIFSKAWRCTSLHSLDDSRWIVFSARRKRRIERYETLNVCDRPILIRTSAFRAADGTLAKKAARIRQFRAVQEHYDGRPLCVKYSKLFLLRNFNRTRRRLTGLRIRCRTSKTNDPMSMFFI